MLEITADVSANKFAGSWISRIGLEVVSGSNNIWQIRTVHMIRFANLKSTIVQTRNTISFLLRLPGLPIQDELNCVLDIH
jgi:hypothetical protein